MKKDADEMNRENNWALNNWDRDMKKVVKSHQKQLEKLNNNLEGEVQHLMV